MEGDTMGKALVAAKIENLEDLSMAARGQLPVQSVRAVEVADALVDTGAMSLSLPKRLIQELGLLPFRVRKARTSAGIITLQVYSAVRLTIADRDCLSDVTEIPDDCPALIGQVPLELLDFVVDPGGRRLIGNPAHGGEHMIDLF